MKKRILFCLAIMLSGIHACSDDIEFPIDGMWQLKAIEENGITTPVDTVFYSFMKGTVFSYTILKTPDVANVFYGYIDALSEKEILIKVDDKYFFERDFIENSDWEEQQQIFGIESINSRKLILSYGEKTYSFNKH